MFRFLFDGDGFSFTVEFYDTETLRIVHVITEDSSTFSGFCIFYRCVQTFGQSVTGENVVTQNHSYRVITDEFFSDDECLCQSVRTFLYSIGQIHTKLMTVA